MGSPGHSSASSPTYKHLKTKHKQSPIELKEMMRKNYREKIQNCRYMLLDRFRSSEANIRETLTDIYKSVFNFDDEPDLDSEETDVLEEIQRELVQGELEWCTKEYERSQMDNVDWSTMEQDNVICLICQKDNLCIANGLLTCPQCHIEITTDHTLSDIKKSVESCLSKHSTVCGGDIQFSIIAENNENHIYLICQNCSEIYLVV